ncbi:hypothetical protein BRARA_C00988 [Brassica rapa]|uniref:Uncharacterized protein n=1 Tax=Brassica campestris TaxID=3711 RepID=A0A397ZUJ6_BRACM|nr:hypothetical protein BRARA_C00988 [Brassica rapa]
MNHLIILFLSIAICFGFEGSSGCAPNILQFKNQIGAGETLLVSCWSNRGQIKGVETPVEFNKIYNFEVEERGKDRIVWKCELKNRKATKFLLLWRAYRGAARKRCGQIREYVADTKRVSLEVDRKMSLMIGLAPLLATTDLNQTLVKIQRIATTKLWL